MRCSWYVLMLMALAAACPFRVLWDHCLALKCCKIFGLCMSKHNPLQPLHGNLGFCCVVQYHFKTHQFVFRKHAHAGKRGGKQSHTLVQITSAGSPSVALPVAPPDFSADTSAAPAAHAPVRSKPDRGFHGPNLSFRRRSKPQLQAFPCMLA